MNIINGQQRKTLGTELYEWAKMHEHQAFIQPSNKTTAFIARDSQKKKEKERKKRKERPGTSFFIVSDCLVMRDVRVIESQLKAVKKGRDQL